MVTIADAVARSAYQMGKTPLLPIFAASLGAGDAFMGLIVSVSTLTGVMLKPLVGIFSDRWGRCIWLLAGTAFFAGIPFLYQFVQTPNELLILRLGHGLATAIYGPVTLAYVAEQTCVRRRAEKLGIFGMARSLAYILGPALAGWMLLTLDPAQVFTVIGLMSALAFIPVLRLPEPAQPTVSQHPRLKEQIVQALRSGSRTPVVWISGALEAWVFTALYAVKAFLPIYALSAGLSVLLVGLFFSVQEAAYFILRPVGGRVGDRKEYRRTIAAGMLLLGLTLPVLTMADSAPLLLALAVIMGMAQALVFPCVAALVSTTIDRRHMGANMGFVGTLRSAGKVLGPIVGGLLILWFDYTLMLRLMGLTLFLAGSLTWLGGKNVWLSNWRLGQAMAR